MFRALRPSSGALDAQLQHMVFCTVKNETTRSVCIVAAFCCI